MLQHLIFDMDGTLIDSLPGIEHSARLAVAEVLPGRSLPPLAPFVGPPVGVVFERALGSMAPATLDALVAAFRRHYNREGWRHSVGYPGVAGVLEDLRSRGLALYIVTNKPALPTGRILEHLGLTLHFAEVVSPDSASPATASKAEAVRRLLTRRGLAPAATWLVGDSAEDRQAAHANELAFVAAAYGYGGVSGDRQLRALADLPTLLGE